MIFLTDVSDIKDIVNNQKHGFYDYKTTKKDHRKFVLTSIIGQNHVILPSI